MRKPISIGRALALASLLGFRAIGAPDPVDEISIPKYQVTLVLSEFSMLNNSIISALTSQKAGGIDLNYTVEWAGDHPQWIISTQNPAAFGVLQRWAASETLNVVNELEPGQAASRDGELQALKTLGSKLKAASTQPIYEEREFSGVVERTGDGLFLQTGGKQARLTTGNAHPRLPAPGARVVAEGYVARPGEVTVNRWREAKPNTLDVFVMGKCPFGVDAAARLLKHSAAIEGGERPVVNVHYLYHRVVKDGGMDYGSMHGDAEVVDNLVQICLRDSNPGLYQRYMENRAANLDADWKTIAEKAGASEAEIARIEKQFRDERVKLIEKELRLVETQYGVIAASPRYFWEGKAIADVKKIPVFDGVAVAAAGEKECSN